MRFWVSDSSKRHLGDMLEHQYEDWVVVREACQIFEHYDWQPNVQGDEYLNAMYPGFCHSLHIERGFNDSRDAETRGARHKQRSESRCQVALGRLANTKSEWLF